MVAKLKLKELTEACDLVSEMRQISERNRITWHASVRA